METTDSAPSAEPESSAARRSVYVLGLPVPLRDTVRACFPQFTWVPEEIAEARFRAEVTAEIPSFIPTEPTPHDWVSKLSGDDIVAFWDKVSSVPTKAIRMSIERGAFCDPDTAQSLAFGCVNLVLRSIDGGALPELAGAKIPRFAIAGDPARRRLKVAGEANAAAAASGEHDIAVVGRRRTLLSAIERFPDRRITAFTTGKQPLAVRVEWLNNGIRVIHRADQIAALISRAGEVVTDVIEIAVASEAAGSPATFVGELNIFEKVRADLSASSEAPVYYGFADAGSGETLTAESVVARWSAIVGAVAADGPVDTLISPSKITHIVVGQPRRGVTPISRHFGPAAYSNREHAISKADFTANAELFSHCNLVVCADGPTSESWGKLDIGGARRIFEPSPLDIPLKLNLSDAFVPMFGCHRYKQDGERYRYALAADVDALSASDRADYAAQGQQLRPLLSRLQTSGRLARFNKFEMGRKFGPIGYERILVLGARDDSELIESNPERVADIAVLKATLNAHRQAKVLYAPEKRAAADVSHIAAAKALDPRVEIVTGSFSISEFAHIVTEVRTVDSALGVFALAAGLRVLVYGRPFYAGLGVTLDIAPSGAERAPEVSDPLDLDTFLGWYFKTNVFCADALSGEPIPIETLATDWSPYLGELSDEISDRLMERAVDPKISAADLQQLLKVLDKHGKRARLARLIAELDLTDHVASGHPIAFDIAREYALQGMWRDSVSLIFALWLKHGEPKLSRVADALVTTRSLLNSSAEISDFEYFVLSKFRSLSSAQIRKIGDTFRSNRYFRAALAFYSSCFPSKELLAIQAECHIGLGDIETAGALLEELVSQQEATPVVEQLTIEWLRRQNRLEEILPIIEKRAAAAAGDADVKLQLATLHHEVGNLTKAIEHLSFLVRSRLGTKAVRDLAAIYVAQMHTAKARGLLRAQLDIAPVDTQAWRLLGDAYSFENDLEAAGECFYTALTLSPLDFASHARLVEIEEELAKADGRPDRWTGALDEMVASVDQPSVETLIGQGRARLTGYDFENLKRNCLRVIALFPEDSRGHFWYGHACAWEMSEKSPEVIAEIRKSYQIALARDRDDMIGTILDAIRSLAKIGDIEGIRMLVREHKFALYVGNKEKLDVARYSASMALGDYLGVFEAMRYLQRTRVLKRNPKHFRFVTSLDEVGPTEELLLLSEGGVGDEMRCSTMIPELIKRFPKAIISVDERLYTLFQRSFPKVKRFSPVPRYHRTRINNDMLGSIGDLPEQAFAAFFDNNLWREAGQVDVVLPIQCALADLRRTDEDFAAGQKVRFIPREDLVQQWRERLRPYADRLIVGATWTSMYRDYRRIESYLTHEEMEPLFRTPGAVFVNCQYENIQPELNWAREKLGVEILDFPDLDKRDDFERLAALVACLDLFVGTGTTTTEFAALVGCPTIYASPSNMNAYRNPAFTETDLFYKDMRMIRPIPASDRGAMVRRMAALLAEAVEVKRQSATVISIPAAANTARKAQA